MASYWPLQETAYPGGSLNLIAYQRPGIFDVAGGVPIRDVHINVAGQHAVFIANHGRPAYGLDIRKL